MATCDVQPIHTGHAGLPRARDGVVCAIRKARRPMTLAITLAAVLVFAVVVCVAQYVTRAFADPLDDLPPLLDTWHGFWPKGPRHE